MLAPLLWRFDVFENALIKIIGIEKMLRPYELLVYDAWSAVILGSHLGN